MENNKDLWSEVALCLLMHLKRLSSQQALWKMPRMNWESVRLWVGMAFSTIYQFAREEESTALDKNLFVANVSGVPELIGRNISWRLIAGFVNWLDVLCGSSREYPKDVNDASDIRKLVMAVLDKCGFSEADQEGVVKSIQDFAIDVYNNLCDEEKQIDAETVELFVCDYIMQFLVSLQKRAEGVTFAQAAAMAGSDFVRRCQVAGYGMLSILKKGSTAIGKAAPFVAPREEILLHNRKFSWMFFVS